MSADESAPRAPNGLRIANGAVTLLLTRVAGVLLAWLLEVVLVRMLSPGEWNVMSRFLTLLTLFSILQFGFPESVLYFAAKASSRRAGLRLTMRTSALLTVVGALLAIPVLTLPAVARFALGEDGPLMALPLALYVLCDLAFSPLPSLLLAEGQPRMASVLSFGARIPTALSVVIAIALKLGLVAALYGMALGAAFALLLGWLLVLRAARRSEPEHTPAARPPSLATQLSFSAPVGFTRLVQIGNAKLDKYVVMTVFAESVYGTYYLGASEFPVPSLICTAVASVMMTDLVSLSEHTSKLGFVRLWHASIEKIALAVMPMFWFTLLFAEPLIRALYGAAHAEAAQQFRIFQLLLLWRVTNFSNISLALGRPRVPLIAAAIALVLNGLLSILFIRGIGIYGPAVANVLANALSTVYTLYAIRAGLGVAFAALLPMRRYVQTLLVAFAAVAPTTVLLWLNLPAGLLLTLAALLSLAAYVLFASKLGIMDRADRRFLIALLTLRAMRVSSLEDR